MKVVLKVMEVEVEFIRGIDLGNDLTGTLYLLKEIILADLAGFLSSNKVHQRLLFPTYRLVEQEVNNLQRTAPKLSDKVRLYKRIYFKSGRLHIRLMGNS